MTELGPLRIRGDFVCLHKYKLRRNRYQVSPISRPRSCNTDCTTIQAYMAVNCYDEQPFFCTSPPFAFDFQLNTLVKHVEPETLRNGQTIWMVTYEDLDTKVETTKTFDAVVLCNGHYTVGHVPYIPGIESFPGGRIHSHQYRIPSLYARKKVCILGASWSGIDIAIEVSQYAEKVCGTLLFIRALHEI